MPARFIATILILASGAFCSAQFNPGQWVGDLYFVEAESGSGNNTKYRRHFIDEKNNVVDPHDYRLSSDHEFCGQTANAWPN